MQNLTHQRRTDSVTAPVRVTRRDRATLMPGERTPEGYLRVHSIIARPGVMEYEAPDGTVARELIPADELHKADSLRSLASMPVTLGHPPEDVTPDNVAQYGVGSVGEEIAVIEDEGLVRVVMVLRRRDVLDAVAAGTDEVSPGYSCFIDPTPGRHPVFGPYDAVQRDRRYNHTAVVDEARGGPSIHLRADGRVQKSRLDAKPTQPAEAPMNPLLLMIAAMFGISSKRADGEGELTEDAMAARIADAIRKMQAEIAEAEAEKEGVDDPEALKAEIATLKAKLTELEAAETERADQEAEEEEKEEQTKLDTLAKRLEYDTAAWRADTTNVQRRLDIARHVKLLKADEDPGEATVIGMVETLHRQDAVSATPDPWTALRLDARPPAPTDQTRDTRSDDRPARGARAADPFKENLKKRRDAATR